MDATLDARWDGPGQIIHWGLFKVWRLDLVGAVRLLAVSGGGLG
jgi:hypothetical protein